MFPLTKMWINPFNYRGDASHPGELSGLGVIGQLLSMDMVTLVEAYVLVYERSSFQLHRPVIRGVSGKTAYELLADYLKSKHFWGGIEFDRLQFSGSTIYEREGLKRIEAFTPKGKISDTNVYQVGIMATEQPLFNERLKRDLITLVEEAILCQTKL